MNSKPTSMLLFVLSLVVLGPIGLIAGLFGLGWAWESFSGCFLSLSYVCGQVEWFKAFVFLMIAAGCFTVIKNMWEKSK
jgi:hypothetical protein